MATSPGFLSSGSTTAPDTVVAGQRRSPRFNGASWGAIFAGVVTALVVQLLLNVLGVGIGASTLDATSAAANPSAAGFSTTAGIWVVASGIVASLAGGVVAGRLCGSSIANTARWHGFVSWAATTLVIVYLATAAAGGIIGGAFSALGSTIGAAGRGAASAASGVAANTDGNALEAQVRQLVNPNDAQSVQDSIIGYIRASSSGDTAGADAARDRAVESLARVANISPDEARNRIAQAEQQYRQAADTAKQKAAQAAEATRKGLASAGIFGFGALALGALAAWLGGGLGTSRHDGAAGTSGGRREYLWE